jgi:prepilin-type N-terminal cleavage/methylation domain-containing protein
MLFKVVGRRRGFTLIEMIAVTVLIAVLASIVVSRLQNSRDGISFQRGIQGIESAANKAKSQAIQTGRTFELTFDDASQSLKVEESNPEESTNTPSSGSSSEDTPNGDTSIGSGWSVFEVRKPDGSTESSLSIKFFADGTAESKSVEFHSGNAPISLIVKQNGSIEVKRGALSEEANEEWEAGNIEQRATQQ